MPGILAEGAITFLIYLFIAVIWVVGKIMQQKDAQRKVEELKRRREEREREGQSGGMSPAPEVQEQSKPKKRSLEDDLQDFLGRMAGLDPEPEPKPAPKQQPPIPRQKEALQFDGPAPPPHQPRRRPTASQKDLAGAIEKAQLPKGGKSVEDVYAKIADVKDIEELELAVTDGTVIDQSSLLNVRTLMVDMSKSNVKMQRFKIQNIRPVRTKTSKPNMGNRANIKQAIVGGILLSQPKALREDPFHSNPGEL